MSDLEFEGDSDQEVSENHWKLIDDVRQLDKGQRIQALQRDEPTLEASEFGIVKRGINNQVSKRTSSSKPQVLRKPLEKQAAERIKRVVAFKNTRKELGKWAGVVARNRTAASISFPLSQSSMKLEPIDGYLKRYRLQSDLERKLAELEPQPDPEDDKDEFPLTLEEILERRKEAAKFRAQQSYKIAKAHRQNKIKSKKFHRIQRKEKIRKTLKEFEELQKTDPQAALEKLEELDKARAEERMTLRHKSTGQWAQSKLIRAKYDKESRQVLAEQLAISRELTQKLKKEESDEDDDDAEQAPLHLPNSDKENPWMNAVKTESEIDNFISGYRKYWEEKNKLEKNENEVNENGIKNNSVYKSTSESDIKRVPPSKNPVKRVIEEYLPGQNGFSEHSGTDKFEIDDKKILSADKKLKKNLQKTSKDKLGTKLPKSKIAKANKFKVKAGTSKWSISPAASLTEDNSQIQKDIDIDDMFDSVEDRIQDKINRKLSKVKLMLDKEEKNKNRKNRKKRKNDSESDLDKLALKGQKPIKPIIDKPIEESTGSQPANENSKAEKIISITDFNRQVTSKTKTEIDPNKFMNMKPKHIKTMLPDEVGGEEEALDDNEIAEDQHQIISEAFADDDVVDEFRKEKEEEIKKSQPEDIDLRLPGWGSWGGKDIKEPTRKKRRFIIKVPKEAPRRDENKGDVVIIEEKCPKIKQHLVSELPHPFTSVQDYEASIRAPVGRDFVPEKTFSKLIQPAIKTKMGKVIEPMSEDALTKSKGLKKRKKKEVREEPKMKKPKGNSVQGNPKKKLKRA